MCLLYVNANAQGSTAMPAPGAAPPPRARLRSTSRARRYGHWVKFHGARPKRNGISPPTRGLRNAAPLASHPVKIDPVPSAACARYVPLRRALGFRLRAVRSRFSIAQACPLLDIAWRRGYSLSCSQLCEVRQVVFKAPNNLFAFVRRAKLLRYEEGNQSIPLQLQTRLTSAGRRKQGHWAPRTALADSRR